MKTVNILNSRLSVLLMLLFLTDGKAGVFPPELFSIKFQVGVDTRRKLSETLRLKLDQIIV